MQRICTGVRLRHKEPSTTIQKVIRVHFPSPSISDMVDGHEMKKVLYSVYSSTLEEK